MYLVVYSLVGPQGMLEFSPPKETRFHVQTSPASSVGSRIGSGIFLVTIIYRTTKLYRVTPGRFLRGPACGVTGLS
jgi:hypothetical protein